MTKKLWIVWALCLILPGGLGLGVYRTRESDFRRQVAQAREAKSKDSTIKDYIRMYEQWSALDPETKADNPWGFGEYGGADIRKQLQAGQSDRLLVDFTQLAKGINHYPGPLAEVIYGVGWQEHVDEYGRSRTRSEVLLTASTFLAACGALIFFGGLARLALLSFIQVKKNKSEAAETSTDESPDQPKASESQDAEPAESGDSVPSEEQPEPDSDAEITAEEPDKGYFGRRKKNSSSSSSKTSIAGLTSLSQAGPASTVESRLGGTTKDSYFGWAVDENETPALEKLMTSEPLTSDLSALTEEVSAIREFAAQQQDQVRKLQDGYDWMIIRRFCQRIIRCVDNIEDRFECLKKSGDDAADYLEDIRDELIFALESSGVEQFRPDLKTPFKGLEKYVEAVRKRASTDDESLTGTIAEVIRPGYQYLVSDEDVKIIRCAQVKLYETEKSN